eukprot:TRINITY_DN21443_c0_g1_i1.p1 TRINITY_DN21443_c0_g1~~TRINITY_DN21443_c0_g1_i1.p1  ORF type:complete len:548 (-),score=67.82 TRINITY_DN21443_c0_g1_i1:129-1772(-)
MNQMDDDIFNTFSEDSSSSPFHVYEVAELLVILSHKPRGSKGVWQQVHKDEKLRVTKGKGKRLRLEVQLNDDCQSDTTKLFLTSLDGDVPTVLTEGVTLEAAKTVGTLLEMEIKLYEVCKRLQFLVQVQTHSGATVSGRSIEFMTHNSGTASTIRHTKEKSPDITNSVSQQISHPNPSPPNTAPLSTSAQDDYSKKRPRMEGSPASMTDSSPPILQDVTIVPNSLEVNGDVKARAYLQFSDIRLKTNVVDLVDALSIVTALQGKSYEWKKGTPMESAIGGQRVIGLIAQEVQKVLPEVVHEDPSTGILAVSYIEILPVVIEAFKQFLNEYKDNKTAVQFQLDELRDKIDIFQNQKTQKEREQFLQKLTQSSRRMTAIFRDKSKSADIEKANSSALSEREINIYPQANYKSEDHKISKGRFLVCRMTQIVFVISLILSTGLFIAGLLLMIPNVPKNNDTQIVEQGNNNVSVLHDGKRYNHYYYRAEPQNFTESTSSTTASDIFIIEPPGLDTDFVIGVVLLCLGVIGMIISGVGLLFSSVWMCSGEKT